MTQTIFAAYKCGTVRKCHCHCFRVDFRPNGECDKCYENVSIQFTKFLQYCSSQFYFLFLAVSVFVMCYYVLHFYSQDHFVFKILTFGSTHSARRNHTNLHTNTFTDFIQQTFSSVAVKNPTSNRWFGSEQSCQRAFSKFHSVKRMPQQGCFLCSQLIIF